MCIFMRRSLNLSLPGGQGVCILYARVVFALSSNERCVEKVVIFVVIRTFLRIDLVFITRGVCFSSDDDATPNKKRTKHMLVTLFRSVFYRA